MFSHVFIGIDDFVRALRFYDALMQALGIAPERLVIWESSSSKNVPATSMVALVASAVGKMMVMSPAEADLSAPKLNTATALSVAEVL